MIEKSRSIALLIFIFPIISVNIILILSQSLVFKSSDHSINSPFYANENGNYFYNLKVYEPGNALRDRQDIKTKGFAIPYIDGSTSISRLGRVNPNNFIFKPFMILTGVLICIFWLNQKKIFNKILPDKSNLNRISILGIITGVSLIIHIAFLGVNFENDFYKLFVRLVLATSVISAIASKYYYVKNILKLKKNNLYFCNNTFLIQKCLVYFLILILFLSLPLLILNVSKSVILIIEWNYFLILFSFYLLYFFSWKNYTFIQPPPNTLSPN